MDPRDARFASLVLVLLGSSCVQFEGDLPRLPHGQAEASPPSDARPSVASTQETSPFAYVALKQSGSVVTFGSTHGCLVMDKVVSCGGAAFPGVTFALQGQLLGKTNERGILKVDLNRAFLGSTTLLPVSAPVVVLLPGMENQPLLPGVGHQGFRNAKPLVVDLRPVLHAREESAWGLCDLDACRMPRTPDACDLEKEYLRTYPEGEHADDAKAALDAAMPAMNMFAEVAAWAQIQPAMRSCQDPTSWVPASFDLSCAPLCPGSQSPNCDPLAKYIRNFPVGAHADEVKLAMGVAAKLKAQIDKSEQRQTEAMGAKLNQQVDQVLVMCRKAFPDNRAKFDACVRRQTGP